MSGQFAQKPNPKPSRKSSDSTKKVEPVPSKPNLSRATGVQSKDQYPISQIENTLEQEQHQEVQQQEKIRSYQQELIKLLEHTLNQMGYMPPNPSPFLRYRTFQTIVQAVLGHNPDPDISEAISVIENGMGKQYGKSYEFFWQMASSLNSKVPVFSSVMAFLQRFDPVIEKATLSIEMPKVSPSLEARMLRVERFLAQDWVADQKRGVLAIHVDEETRTTILQIGIASHGPVYITIPRVIRPDEVAQNSIWELLKRIESFREDVDPMAVIDGSYQKLNFNELFAKSRVIRAPSGDTVRLTANMIETAKRDRLYAENTIILNSSPSTLEQYVSVFPNDRSGRNWSAWGNEAQLWNDIVTNASFVTSPESSRAAFLNALTQSENVVVIVAHCDGRTIFMPDPRPDGTTISDEYLREHRDQITANKPFVYLFSCEAGDLTNLQNFASTLLDCGVSGVVASQTILGAAEGRTLLARLLAERRSRPPIEDFWQAIREVSFFEMEVFLA